MSQGDCADVLSMLFHKAGVKDPQKIEHHASWLKGDLKQEALYAGAALGSLITLGACCVFCCCRRYKKHVERAKRANDGTYTAYGTGAALPEGEGTEMAGAKDEAIASA